MLDVLLHRGAKREEQHYLGTTVLHWASRRGGVEIMSLLIEHGADVNRVGRKFSEKGQTPLQLARGRGHDKAVRLLEQHGATT